MDFSNIELPSNRKFGFFFSAVFLVIYIYFYIEGADTTTYIFASLSVLFFFVTLIKADLLLPLNKLWMRFGFLIGMIVSPIVLGIIFFGLFTPIAICIRLAGRDELRLRLSTKASHWIKRDASIESDSFKYQF